MALFTKSGLGGYDRALSEVEEEQDGILGTGTGAGK